MSKANKKALDWLPKRKDGRKRYYNCNDDGIRSIYAKGYRKAEKDLELTWKDIKTIDRLLNQCVDYSNPYQEVLKRFKAQKEE